MDGKPCFLKLERVHNGRVEIQTCFFESHLDAMDTAEKWVKAGWQWELIAVRHVVARGETLPCPTPVQMELF